MLIYNVAWCNRIDEFFNCTLIITFSYLVWSQGCSVLGDVASTFGFVVKGWKTTSIALNLRAVVMLINNVA
jgi:hypothetical protein